MSNHIIVERLQAHGIVAQQVGKCWVLQCRGRELRYARLADVSPPDLRFLLGQPRHNISGLPTYKPHEKGVNSRSEGL